MLADYHTHHYRCGHATGTLVDYVESAMERGLTEIGLSDHSPIYHFRDDPQPFPKTAMHRDELERYIREMEQIRERYSGKIQIRLGVESDYIVGWDDFYRNLWSRYPLDYVIGSVHWLGAWNIFWELPEGTSAVQIYEQYFHAVQAAAQSGVFDIIGHLDVHKTRHPTPRDVTPLVQETLQVIKDSDVAIELNTSGWRKDVNECYPSPSILKVAAEYAIPVTLGSDAHEPHLVASGFERALALLKECGFTELALFKRRKRYFVPMEAALEALRAT